MPTLRLKFNEDDDGTVIWPPEIQLLGFHWGTPFTRDDIPKRREYEYECFIKDNVEAIDRERGIMLFRTHLTSLLAGGRGDQIKDLKDSLGGHDGA